MGKEFKEGRRGKVKCHSCPLIIYKIKVSNMNRISNIRKPRKKKIKGKKKKNGDLAHLSLHLRRASRRGTGVWREIMAKESSTCS